MRLRRQLPLRLACATAFVAALLAAPGALAQGAPATTFSAAGSAIDINSVQGPCAVAVAGVSSGALAGSGTFTAAEGQEGSGSGPACGGAAASIHYDVVSESGSGGTLTLGVRVTASDDAVTPAGTTGTITISSGGQTIDVAIGPHVQSFGNGLQGSVDLRSNVSVATDPAVVSVDFYAGTGSSHPLVTSIGPCITATAGTQTVTDAGTTSRGGGSYQAATPGNDPNGATCTGGRGRFSYVVDTATSDGATAANAAVTVTDAADDASPGSTAGTTTLDSPTQRVDIAVGAHSAGFGPGHSGFGGFLDLRGDVEIGSSSVVGTTDLQLTKTAPSSVAAGSPISYQLTAKNVSLTPATSVQLDDTLPPGVTYLASTASQGTCAPSAGAVACALGTIAAGGQATVTITVGTTSTTPSPVANTATVHSSELDATPGNDNATAVTTLSQPTLDLSVQKSASPSPALVGSDLDYTLVVANAAASSGSATGTTLTDTLPAGVTFTSASSGCTQAAGVVTCSLGTLAPGASATVHVHVTPTAAGTLTNSASVSSDQADANPANNATTIQTQANAPSADVSVVKTSQPVTVTAGADVVYHVVVSNAGPQAATGTTLTDALPAGVTFVSVTPAAPTCTTSGATVTCALGTLASGASTAVDITVATSATTPPTVSNTATVTAADDTTPANDSSTATTTVTPAATADLNASVIGTPDPVRVGYGLLYRIRISNNGPQAATNVVATDTLPASTVFYVAHPSQGSCTQAGGVISCNLGTLAPGAYAVIEVVVKVTQTGTIRNTVTAASAQVDPNPGDNTCTVATQVTV